MFVWLHESTEHWARGQIQYYAYANKNDIELLKIFIKCIAQSELRPDASVNTGNWGRAWLRVCYGPAAMMDDAGQTRGWRGENLPKWRVKGNSSMAGIQTI